MSNFEIIQPGGRPEGSDQPTIKSPKQAAPASKVLRTAISLLLAGLPLLAMPSLTAAAPARSADKDIGGFPSWYQDNTGIRVGLCYNPNDVNCVAPISATYNPALPLAFPSNYPDELFYSAADSDLVVVPPSHRTENCPSFTPPAAVANPGSRIHMALEAAFLNGTITAGDQMVFGRLRVISTAGNGLCPATWYTFRTPYGPITLQTDQNAEIQGAVASAATNDVGCLPGPVSACNFDLAMGAPVLGVGLLHQINPTTSASTAAPGYLGNGLTLGNVTGGLNGFNQFDIVKWPAGVTPSASGVGADCHDAACTVIGSTNQFSVAAKLAGPISAVDTVDFGGQLFGTTSAPKTITLTNLGQGIQGLPITITATTRTGNTASFPVAVATNRCLTTLARDASCTLNVTFNANVLGARNANLNVVAGGVTVKTIALKGTALSAGAAPAASFNPADGNLDFGAVRLTTAGKTQSVTVTNTGSAPLQAIPSLTGSNAYSINANSCSGGFVPVGGSCTIGLNFVPSAVGPVTAQLGIATNVTGLGTFVINLSGHGTGGIAAVSATNNAVNTFPEWYQDETGLRVGQCDNPSNSLCIAAPVVGGVSFPTNYPDEWFYYIAQSAPIAVSDPICGLPAGPIFVEAGMEAAFLGQIGPNLGTTFGRLRIVSRGGLCPNTEYQLTHPYGQSIIATDDLGNIKPAAGTTDVGCLGAPCDYSIALSAPVFEGFLKQTVRPDGYLGDPLAPSTVTGAPFIDKDGNPANYFKVERLDAAGTGQEIGLTTEFGVSGRLVGPMIASPVAEEFGGVEVGLTAAAVTKTITFTNDGPFNVTLAATNLLSIEGNQLTDYSITGTTCSTSQVLAHAQSCTVDVKFLPTATGDRNANLRLHHSGGNDPLGVPLHGIGNSPAGTAAISSNISSIKFTDLHVGLHSESATVTLSNVGGSSALRVGSPTVTAQSPFVINSNTCTGVFVQPNEVCTLSVQFQPSTVSNFSATLSVPSNANSGVLSIPLTGKSSNVIPAQSGSINTANMPNWYQDGNGIRVEPCLTQDGNCTLLADAFFDPSLPLAWPNNFPSESFYSLLDAEVIAVPADASCGAIGGQVLFRVATEASFTPINPGVATAPALSNLGIFNRIRVLASGLCPNTIYDFMHPYGVSNITTDANGDIRPRVGTVDNNAVIASEPMRPGIVQWDPNTAPLAPAGYLGDARTLHTIVGSQFRPSPNAEPANYFKVIRKTDSKVVGETKLFTVAGRIPGPIVSNLDGKDFLTVEMGKNSTTQNFVISNIGNNSVSAFTASLGGTHASLFSIVTNSCATSTLATDQTCIIGVQFNPTVAAGSGAKSATLTLGHNGLRSPLSIALKGTAIAVQTPALAITSSTVTVNAVGTPPSLSFGLVAVNATSPEQVLTITNSGSGDLKLNTLAISGTNPTQYAISGTTCSNGPTALALSAGSSCTVKVVFKPTSSGSKPATIAINATDAVTAGGHVAVAITPVNVALTGTGTSSTLSLSGTTAAISTATGTTGTERITITNTGTAPLNVTGATKSRVDARWTATFTGCTAVAVGRKCTMNISWNLGNVAGAAAIPAVGGTSTMGFTLISNASNTATVNATGTRSR